MTFHGTSATHPPVGTVVDDGMLTLIEVLGIGGYGVCYKAIDYSYFPPRTVAVKCLILSQPQSSRQHQLHLKEVMLHQLASGHPGIVSLRRIVREGTHTYIVMDYAPDGDLFSQILNHKRYLGNDALIKHVFLQLLDAIEYCHRLGIYHRDLKPENVLCFEGGYNVAITDFGLATTDKMSGEFRTGSIYHMSPECHGTEFTLHTAYSPLHNDVWSLAIVLLNLTTGRNPWKSATMSDPTFQAYVEDPLGFLPSVLPISHEVNSLLIHMLALDWRDRPTVAQVRECFETIDTFYAPGAIFEGSMARCPWEGRTDESEVVVSDLDQDPSVSIVSKVEATPADTTSRWSADSGLTSEINFAAPLHSGDEQWTIADDQSGWIEHPDLDTAVDIIYDSPATPPFTHSISSADSSNEVPSYPTTPNSIKTSFDNDAVRVRQGLAIDIQYDRVRSHLEDDDSLRSSLMQTAMGSPCSASAPSASLMGLMTSNSDSLYHSGLDRVVSRPLDKDTTDLDFECESPVSAPSIRWARIGISDDDDPLDESPYPFQNPTFLNLPPSEASSATTSLTTFDQVATKVQVNPPEPTTQTQCKPQERSVRRKSIFLRSPRTWFSGSRLFWAVEAT